MAVKVREPDAHSPKRWVAGSTTSSTSRREVMMWRLEVYQRYSRRNQQQQLLAGEPLWSYHWPFDGWRIYCDGSSSFSDCVLVLLRDGREGRTQMALPRV